MKQKISCLLLLSCCLAIGLQAQTEDLRSDSLFFKSQSNVFQEWLHTAGLGEVLTTDTLIIRKRKLMLSLDFNFTAEDTAYYAWKRLKADFEVQSALPLEERLFYKLANLMGLQHDQLILKIKNTPSYSKLPTLDARMVYVPDSQLFIWKAIFRSTIPDSVYIPEFKLGKACETVNSLVKTQRLPEEWIYTTYEKLTARMVRYFKSKVDSVEIRNKNPIELRVMNIKSEAIPAGRIGIFNPHELLTYTVSLKKEKEGLRLFCTVDGRYGNGLWKLRSTKGFRDMSPEYDQELYDYTSLFTKTRLFDMLEEVLNAK